MTGTRHTGRANRMIDTLATVERNDEVASGYRLLILHFKESVEVRPGQFAMLRAHTVFEPLLRRALAVYRVHSADRLAFLYHVLGRGTAALASLRPNDQVEALVPLGNHWPIPGDPLTPTGRCFPDACDRAIVVAGGIGSASVLLFCDELIKRSVPTEVFFGAATGQVAIGCGLDDFRKLGLPLSVASDDGTVGERAFVTAPLERRLRSGGGKGATIYACGPWPMMRRVAEIADQFRVPCLVSLEAPMGCGFGVCVGCVVGVKTEGPIGYQSYRRVCVDGTIFPSDVIRWDVNAMAH